MIPNNQFHEKFREIDLTEKKISKIPYFLYMPQCDLAYAVCYTVFNDFLKTFCGM